MISRYTTTRFNWMMLVTNPFSRAYFYPRYWLTWLGIGGMYLLAYLPATLQLWIGKTIGWLSYHVAKDRRHITQVNIRLCFPELDAYKQEQLVKDTFISNGIAFVETCRSWWIDAEQWRQRVNITGLEHIENGLREGRGVLLVGAHFSTLDIAGALLSLFIKLDVTYRENKNLLFDAVMMRGRERLFGKVIHRRDIRSMMRSLKNNRVLWYAPDQDYGAKYSVFAPFFGITAATVTGTTRLAEMNNSPVLFFSHFRDDNNHTYTLHISEPLKDFPTGEPATDAARINKIIETEIRKHPEQYLWLHRRFKTRPTGEARPY